jgi:hypothetical protein
VIARVIARMIGRLTVLRAPALRRRPGRNPPSILSHPFHSPISRFVDVRGRPDRIVRVDPST